MNTRDTRPKHISSNASVYLPAISLMTGRHYVFKFLYYLLTQQPG